MTKVWRWTREHFNYFMARRGIDSLQDIAITMGAPLPRVITMHEYIREAGVPDYLLKKEERVAKGLPQYVDRESGPPVVPEHDPLLARLIQFHGKRIEYQEFLKAG